MRSLPRLLLAVDSLEVGGAERHVVDLASALRRKGYGVEVACSVAGELAEPLQAAGVPVWPLTRRLVKRRPSPAYASGIGKLLKERRFDLVHAHIYASSVAAAIAVRGTALPLVITEHTEASWQTWWTRRVGRWAHRRARHIIAVSTPIQRRLTEKDGVSPDLVSLIPNIVIPASDDTPDLSGALPDGWLEGSLVGVVARLQPEKGWLISLRRQPASQSSPRKSASSSATGRCAKSCWPSPGELVWRNASVF